MKRCLLIFASLLGLLVLTGCSTMQIGSFYRPSAIDEERPRDIFIAIDGTGSTQLARTNVARLYEIVDAGSARPASDGGTRELATYYAEGVGSNGNPLGLAVGLGMEDDIRNAYAFLTRTYRTGDRIFLSGFSRGAYAVRALGGLIAVAGIPDLSGKSFKERRRIARKIVDAYKTGPRGDEKGDPQLHFERRVGRVKAVFEREGIAPRGLAMGTSITAMALWDTVEALGWPDRTEYPDEDVGYYLLTNCNVENVFHALSLDDNRAHSFTPIFAEAPHMYRLCEGAQRSAYVEEVWFAGAHSDIAGGYARGDVIDGHLAGVSMNWMLSRLEQFDLFEKGSRIHENPLGPIHDAKGGSAAYRLLTRHFRDPMFYQCWAFLGREAADDPARCKDVPRPKVHHSAIERLAVARQLDAGNLSCPRDARAKGEPLLICGDDLAQFGFVRELLAADCVEPIEPDGPGYVLKPNQKCIEIVDDKKPATARTAR